MLEITNTFFPYQLSLRRKDVMEMRVKIKNSGNDAALVSYKIQLPPELSFDKIGFKAVHEIRAGKLEPGKQLLETVYINARPLTREGITEILIKATEHYNSYDFSLREWRKHVPLVITG